MGQLYTFIANEDIFDGENIRDDLPSWVESDQLTATVIECIRQLNFSSYLTVEEFNDDYLHPGLDRSLSQGILVSEFDGGYDFHLDKLDRFYLGRLELVANFTSKS